MTKEELNARIIKLIEEGKFISAVQYCYENSKKNIAESKQYCDEIRYKVTKDVKVEIEEKPKSIFQRVYDSEINFCISCFWDDGFVLLLGDDVTGKVCERVYVDSWEKVKEKLHELVMKYYPSSKYAKEASDGI